MQEQTKKNSYLVRFAGIECITYGNDEYGALKATSIIKKADLLEYAQIPGEHGSNKKTDMWVYRIRLNDGDGDTIATVQRIFQ